MVTPEQKRKNVEAFKAVIKVAAIGEGPIAPLEEWFSLAAIYPIGGRWYFSFRCAVCRNWSPMFWDFSDGNLGSPFTGGGFTVNCNRCKSPSRIPSESLKSVQWPLDPGQCAPESEYANRVPRTYKNDPEYRPVRGPLHHYTSIDALRSIVKSKSMWATNVYYMTDSSEGSFGLGLMKQVATDAIKSAKGIDAEILRNFVKWIEGPIVKEASVYVLCFSEAHDKLSQWQGFTQLGEGVCISLSSKVLVDLMQRYGWTFQHCRYNRLSQLSWAESILSRIRRQAATARVGVVETKEERIDAVFKDALSDLVQVAATIKDESFVEEQEVRFISPMIDVSDPRVSFRQGRTTKIPYVEFQLADAGRDIVVHEIMAGPGPEQLAACNQISELIKPGLIGNPCKVSASRIPLRSI